MAKITPKRLQQCCIRTASSSGGDCEIRTHGRVAPSAVFKTAGLNHSPKSPEHHIAPCFRTIPCFLPHLHTMVRNCAYSHESHAGSFAI